MRVLHLLKTGRGATWARRQIEVLRAVGIDVAVALPSVAAPAAAEYRALGAEVIAADLDFTVTRPWNLAGAVRRLRAVVARVRPDLIHSHFVSTTLVARLALGRRHPVPRLFQVPGPLHLEHGLFRRLDLATAGPADYWAGGCRATCAAYRAAGVPAEHLFLSYYGTDLGRFGAVPRGGLRRELGIPDDAPLVGMVAYMYRPKWFLGQSRGVKGHEDFLEACDLVLQERADVRALVVGDAWDGAARYAARLRRRAHPAIGFTGIRHDVASVYADLDLAVHPSRSDGCGGAVESLAAGCPTLATEVGGLPDIVIDGTTGWLVPPRDPRRLASAILAALADRTEGKRRAGEGRRLVRGLFAAERTGREIATIYRRILGAGTPEAA